MQKLEKFKKPFVVVGLGKSGLSALKLLENCNLKPHELYKFDEKKESDFKTWNEIESLSPGTLVVSPGVPLKNTSIKKLISLGWQITSEISLACQFITDEKIIGITGSVAKSTVTSLVGEAIKSDDPNAFVGGNLGVPFCEYALRVIQGGKKARYIALELSSYQLENCADLHLEVSAITYLSANHLERYLSADEYYMTKCSIGLITKNICVLNSASKDINLYIEKISCKTLLTSKDHFLNQELLKSIKLLGSHNQDNFCVAYAIAENLKLSQNAIQTMCNFKGLNHRIEFVAEHNGVIFINDSKATAMDSVIVAINAAQEKAQNGVVYALLGGRDKNLPWEDLKILKTLKNVEPVFFGACGELAKAKMQMNDKLYFPTLNNALDKVFNNAKKFDVVLLSPGGTSLDEFQNFEERGNFFKSKVHNFIQRNG